MKISQIRCFLAACEYDSFSQAARDLNVSRSSLTAEIKKLEYELGGLLFLRDRAGCRLTPLGTAVRPRLIEALRQAHQAQAEAARHVLLKRVPIDIGVGETVGQSKISEVIERYRSCNPQADIDLIVDSDAALLQGLRSGRFDIAVMVARASEEFFQIDALYEEDYYAIVSSEHHLSQRKAVTLELLADNEMLDRIDCEMRKFIHTTSEDRGCRLSASYRSNRVDWLIEFARNGAGFLILPDSAIPNEKGLVKLSIEDVQIHRQVAALRCHHQPSRPEVLALLQELTKIT
ncbi:LysR family transcriptional regulator [uncultured Tateyamaria sp.]|uniref:LysR family transcriptional regulator n=1 Tax=uncultured Tateyamaria sp. TaxID=455651 RepID=UPI00261BB5F5|nr:LysR family transcriptional regulator [uncultured Tateyamaria sp.]